jgi:CRP/FNR family transcriptional regulator, cyclic AMP receptor protein
LLTNRARAGTTIGAMEMTVVGDEQPDLVADVAAARRPAALAATRTAVLGVRVGPWAAEELHGPPGHLGLLVLDGLLSREVQLGARSCVELLGAGDLLRPWDSLSEVSTVEIDARWTVQSEIRLAVLDRALALRIGPFPEVVGALMSSLVRRSRWLAFHLAVCHLRQLDLRLRVMFWYMADRWGRVTPDGVVVPLRLTHELLGGLVGAHRSPVTRALGRLAEEGAILRRPDGSWLLRGEPPYELSQLHARAAGSADDPPGAAA